MAAPLTAVAAAPARSPAAWRTIARAMTQTGGASVASGLVSLAATKIIAVVLGPAQVALLATLQQLRATALVGATLNGQTALVQGASARAGAERGQYVRTVLLLMSAATAAAALLLWTFRDPITRYAGLDAAQARLVGWLAVPLLLSAAHIFLTALLNVLGEIGALARLQLVAPLAMAALAYPVARGVAGGRPLLFVAILTVSSAAAVAAACAALWRRRSTLAAWAARRADDAGRARAPRAEWTDQGAESGGPWRQGSAARGFAWGLAARGLEWWRSAFHPSAARRFLAISGALVASGLFASWALVAVRARILRTEGLAVGGQFDAAWAISMNQATLVLASLQTYYLPALARARQPGASPAETPLQIARVLTLAAAAAAVLIAVLAAFKPLVVSLLYSDAFAGAARYLRWTLLGDYLKITSWILSIPLVAAADMRTFLAADACAYGAFVVGAALLARRGPAAEAAAMAFVAMYAVHLIFCGTCLWRRGVFRPDARTAAVWGAGLVLVTGVSALFWNV